MNTKRIIIILGALVIIGVVWFALGSKSATKVVAGSGATSTPTATATSTEAGKHCGGNTANAYHCATGYHCAPVPGSTLPFGDVGGTCVAN